MGGFFGGVHPVYDKELANGRAIETMPLPAKLIVHFVQNLGAPPEPVVEKGAEVKKGQVIARSQGFVSVPVHAPTSGKVKSIDVYPHPVGTDMPACVIEADGNDEWVEGLNVERRDGLVDVITNVGTEIRHRPALPIPAVAASKLARGAS